MIASEDTSDPPPPDIRPSSRSQDHDHCSVNAYPLATRKRHSNWLSATTTTNSLSLVLLAVIAFASIPSAYASSEIYNSDQNTFDKLYADDPFTSLPDTPGGRIRPTPILSLLKSFAAWTLSTFSHALGYELVPASSAGASGLAKRDTTQHIVEACMIPVLVALSGVFAGLTLGYFSVDPTQLQVLSISGTPKQQEYARRIMPVRKDSHLLLTTLILGNMIVNEALPVVADGVLGGGIVAVVISTALVVIFSEIIPQSICSRYGLLIGATMAKPVRVLIWFFFPIGWPVAKLLEYILGAHHGIIYRRSELRELIKMHAAGAEGGGDLDLDTVTMAQGALDLAGKTVKDAMTSIDNVFMLPIEAKLDYETLGHVVRSGHSRIPVYQMVEVPDIDLSAPSLGPPKNKLVKKVIGSLLVKSCVLLDPEDATPLATIPINAIPSVPWNEPLTNMLNAFQEGRSHMAIVSRRGRKIDDVEDAESVMTAAAGGLRQRFMRKVAEISHGKSASESDTSDSDSDVEQGKNEKKFRRKSTIKSSKSSKDSHSSSPTAMNSLPTDAEKIKAEVEADKKKRSLANAAKLTQLEQGVPADAALNADNLQQFFEGLEGAPLGIITLEDVLEELIGEEIYDEYDEHDGPRNAASAFIPREAALAARKAAVERETAALAQATATPLPATNDIDLEQPQPPIPASAPKRVMPKIPIKFTLGKRPASNPGRSRTDVAGLTTTPMEESLIAPVPVAPIAAGSSVPEVLVRPDSEPPALVPSNPPSRSASAIIEPSKGVAFGIEPATAVPARLLSSGITAVPGTPGTGPQGASTPVANTSGSTNLLTEALMIERGRRRLAAAGQPAPPTIRSASATGVLRGTAVTAATPSRQATPPIPVPGAPATTPSAILPPSSTTSTSTSATPGIVAPTPRRTPKFKSIPTPLATTPVPQQVPVLPSAPTAASALVTSPEEIEHKDRTPAP